MPKTKNTTAPPTDKSDEERHLLPSFVLSDEERRLMRSFVPTLLDEAAVTTTSLTMGEALTLRGLASKIAVLATL